MVEFVLLRLDELRELSEYSGMDEMPRERGMDNLESGSKEMSSKSSLMVTGVGIIIIKVF